MIDITAAALATLISSSIATTVALVINKANAKKSLNDQLDAILKIAIQYPYLESPAFACKWNDNRQSDDEPFQRYDLYCNLIFNYMSRLCEHYNFNLKKIEEHLNIRDWIRVHKQCWKNPSTPFENADGYSKEFKAFINQYLD